MTASDAQPEPNESVPLELIAERARKLWQERGVDSTRDIENWFDAEQELRREWMQAEQEQQRTVVAPRRRSHSKK